MIHPLVSANQYIDRHIKNMLIKKGFKGGSLRSKLAGIKQSVKNHWEQNKHVYKYGIPLTVISALALAYLANRGGKDHLKEALHDYFPETATVFQENKIEKLQRMNKEREQRLNRDRARDAINDQNFGNPEINSLRNRAAIAFQSGNEQAYRHIDGHIKYMLTRLGFRGGSLRSKLAGIKKAVNDHWQKNKHVYKYGIPLTVISALALAYLANRGGKDNLKEALYTNFPEQATVFQESQLEKIQRINKEKEKRSAGKKIDLILEHMKANKLDKIGNKETHKTKMLNRIDEEMQKLTDGQKPSDAFTVVEFDDTGAHLDSNDVTGLMAPIDNYDDVNDSVFRPLKKRKADRRQLPNPLLEYVNDTNLAEQVLMDTTVYLDPNENVTREKIYEIWKKKLMRALNKNYKRYTKLDQNTKERIIDNYWDYLNQKIGNIEDYRIGEFFGDEDGSTYSTSTRGSRKSSTGSNRSLPPTPTDTVPSRKTSIRSRKSSTGSNRSLPPTPTVDIPAVDGNLREEIAAALNLEESTPSRKPSSGSKNSQKSASRRSDMQYDDPAYAELADELYNKHDGRYDRWQGDFIKRLGKAFPDLSLDVKRVIRSEQWARLNPKE